MAKKQTEIRITVRCANHPLKHGKILRVSLALGLEYAQMLAGLLDGSSKFYIYPPGPESPIGKCCTCGGALSAEVAEVDVPTKEVPHAQSEK
jgi:hypothetical protein